MHAHRELITGTLKGRLGFDGFVISDWEGIHQIPGDYATQVRTGVNAGIDLFMEPFSYQSFETTLLAEVAAGRVSEARIDDAVRRILTRKFELGLFEHPFTDRRNLDEVGSPAHRALARRAVSESQVLLKNRGQVLSLSGHERIYVAGSNADDIGNQAGGWTVAWQGLSGDTIPGTTILDGIRQVAPDAEVTFSEDASAPTSGNDVGIVVVGETPTPRASATSAARCGRTTACPASPGRCGCRMPTGPPSTGSAARSGTALWWSSPAGRWS
jgi:beta-glucosidase